MHKTLNFCAIKNVLHTLCIITWYYVRDISFFDLQTERKNPSTWKKNKWSSAGSWLFYGTSERAQPVSV